MNKEQNKKILGIDYGSKRVGLAVSDESRKFALPLSVIENDQDLIAKIEKIVLDNEVKDIVLGESRDYKGQPNDILVKSLELKERLEKSGYIVYLEPEFMTSVQAQRLQGKNEMLDASAAAIILQSYLDRSTGDRA